MKEIVLKADGCERGLSQVKSPGVGRIEFWVKLGQKVCDGQAVGIFHRRQCQYLLRLPEHCHGTIIFHKDHDRLIDVEFEDLFLEIRALDQVEGNGPAGSVGDDIHEGEYVRSPMDGMFYIRSSPEASPFVREQDEIKPGQTLGLIEVMKCFYPLHYEGARPARIQSIDVKDATAVSCGTKLFSIALL